MSKTYEELIADLDSKIPRDVVSQRDGGGGRSLSYLEGWYVIDRLNKVIGHGRWSNDVELTKLYEGTIKDKYGKDVYTVHYMAKVTLYIKGLSGEPDGNRFYDTHYNDVGYGDGTDKTNPGKAHELAIKEAVTDGLKRCAKNLGMSMGLALYSKDQENVSDGEDESPKTSSRPVRAEASPSPKDEGNLAKEEQGKSSPSAGAGPDPEKLKATIRSHVKAAIKKGVTDMDKVKAFLSAFGGDNLDAIDPKHLTDVLKHVQGLTA